MGHVPARSPRVRACAGIRHCASRKPGRMRPGATLNAMPRILIIAYGNPLRSDDSIAWRAADALQGKLSKHQVEIIRLHQLGPELAETASHAEYLIFIDAVSDPSSFPGEIRVDEVRSEPVDPKEASRFSHALSPQTVMALAESLYGARTKVFIVAVTGANFDHGESLSPPVEAALPVLIDHIQGIVQSFWQGKA